MNSWQNRCNQQKMILHVLFCDCLLVKGSSARSLPRSLCPNCTSGSSAARCCLRRLDDNFKYLHNLS